MKTTSILNELITYIKSATLGDFIFRKNIIHFGASVDNYRNYLTHAGYLETVSPGMYRYMKALPKNMTYGRLVKEAYPDRDWTQKYNYVPENLDEAIQILLQGNKGNTNIYEDEDKFIAESHHSVGRYLRNTWGLWTGSELQKWFKERGIHHADDMSGIILTSFHRRFYRKEIELEEQIAKYQEYWDEVDPDVNKGLM